MERGEGELVAKAVAKARPVAVAKVSSGSWSLIHRKMTHLMRVTRPIMMRNLQMMSQHPRIRRPSFVSQHRRRTTISMRILSRQCVHQLLHLHE